MARSQTAFDLAGLCIIWLVVLKGRETRKGQSEDNAGYKKPPPWRCGECNRLREEAIKHKRFKKENDSRENCKRYTKARNKYNGHAGKCRKEYYADRDRKLMALRFQDSQKYWAKLKPKSKDRGELLRLPDMVTFFERVTCGDGASFYGQISMVQRALDRDLSEPVDPVLDMLFTDLELDQAIKQLKPGKASGDDELINEIFVHCDELRPCLMAIFNCILSTGYFPKCWTSGTIIPLHKKGAKDKVENYRGITLLYVVSKLFTRLVNNRLSGWAERTGRYHQGQAGFRSGYSTVDNIFVLQNIIERNCRDRKKTFCCFVDYEKAFDRVIHDVLWYKLAETGVQGQMLKVIRDMYQEVKSKVRAASGELSEDFLCVTGVRQGETLSPFLFSLLIRDIEDYMERTGGCSGVRWDSFNTLVLAYADDLAILADTADELQHSMDSCAAFCSSWGLKINYKKTKVMVFRNGHHPVTDRFFMDGEEIEVVAGFCYLGVGFHYSGTVKKTVAHNVLNATRADFKVRTLQRRNARSFMDQLWDYEALVEPVLLYGCESWGAGNYEEAENFHRRCMKRMLGLKPSTCTDLWMLETGSLPLRAKINLRMMSFWASLMVPRQHEKLATKVYRDLQAQEESNWFDKIRDILIHYGLNGYWISQKVESRAKFMRGARKAVQKKEFEEMKARIRRSADEGGKGEWYVNLMDKSEYRKPAWYLTNTDKKVTYELLKLRMRNHKLAVEVGSWYDVESELRNCYTCGVKEDEEHFIRDCPRYTYLRDRFLARWTTELRSDFNGLCSGKDVRFLNNLGHYVRRARKTHQEYNQAWTRASEEDKAILVGGMFESSTDDSTHEASTLSMQGEMPPTIL